MNITKAEMQKAFVLWDKRYIENPEDYLSYEDMEEIGAEEAGTLSMNYFLTLIKEVRNA